MKHYGLSIDPGIETGVCLFSYGDDQSIAVERLWQFPMGAEGIAKFAEFNGLEVTKGRGMENFVILGRQRITSLVVEKFTPRPHESFALTQKAVEPLRGEGVLIGLGLGPFIQWREPSQQYFMGDSRLPLDEKKKLSREFLKLNGMYVTGKNQYFQRPNADDAISATLHAISYVRKIKHGPTLNALFMPDTKEN